MQTIEKQQQKTDLDVQKYKVGLTKPIFVHRRKVLSKIPKFWYIVLAQHEDFQEYIETEDMKYFEYLTDIYVEKMVDSNGSNDDPKTYSLTMSFNSPHGEIANQTVTKYFYTETNPDTGYESVKSHKADIKWPKEFNDVNPILIKKNHKKGTKWSHEEKKNYRIGMKSFFAFFTWTGEKSGKEYRYGEELAELFSEDIFPLAVDYYTLAAPGLGKDNEEEDENTSSEELDIESDEDEDEPEKKKQKKE